MIFLFTEQCAIYVSFACDMKISEDQVDYDTGKQFKKAQTQNKTTHGSRLPKVAQLYWPQT